LDRLLIVEDSTVQSRLLAKLINLEFKIECDIVCSFKETMQLIENNNEVFLGAVVDLVLPDAKDGEVVDFLIKNNIAPIVYTGKYSDEIREKLIAKNIVDYIVKKNTYNLSYVTRLIRRLINNPAIKVLVVDDSDIFRNVLVSYLKVHRYNVFQAENGFEAIKFLKNNPDTYLVIVDFVMPGMDGLELVRQIRMDFSRYKMSVIGISGHDKERISVRFLKSGANDFLLKPFSKEEFYCRVTQNIDFLEKCRMGK
jgi:PleD family two-component response regulator